MKYHHIIVGLLTLFCSAALQGAVLIETQFTGGTLSPLTTSGVGAGRTINVTNANSATYFGTAGDNYLSFDKTASGTTLLFKGVGSATESTSLVALSFDLNMASGNFTLEFFTKDGTTSTNRVATFRFSDTGVFNSTGSSHWNANEAVKLTLVMNNASAPVDYNLNGASSTLGAGKYDVYLNGTLVLANTNVSTNSSAGNGVAVNAFQVAAYTTSLATGRFDNFTLATIPEASSLGYLGMGAGLFLALYRLRK